MSAANERRGLTIAHLGPAGALDDRAIVYRTVQPCRALGELADVSVVSGSPLSPALWESGLLLTADVLVLRDVADPDLLPVIAARRRQGRLTAYEISRHLYATAPGDPDRHRNLDLIERGLTPLLARQADCVQFATRGLEAQFAALNARRAVFPSQLWDAPPPLPLRRLDRVVMGWGGPPAQSEDLRGALPALAGIMDRHPEVVFAVMGDPAVRPLLAPLPAGRLSFTAWGNLHDYYRFLESLDIGIAPLSASSYDRCRGDIRFVEYAAHGVLAVCADMEPYRDVVRPGDTGYLYRDPAELETVLERALAQGDVRAAIPARAARYAASQRLERAHAAERLGFYLSVAAQSGMTLGHGATPAFPPAELADARAAAIGFPASRYLALGQGEADRLMAEGAAHKRAGAIAEARHCFSAAARLAPRGYTPQLWLGMVEEPGPAVEALALAESANPHSCHAPYLRGVRLRERGDTAGAIGAFERARSLAPGFGAPQVRLAEIAEAEGRRDDATRLYEDAALQNSDFAVPIARLAAVALADGKIDKGVGLLERTLANDPDLWLTNFVLGSAFVELKRFHQARVHLRRALDEAEDRTAVLAALAKAEAGLGNNDAAREALRER